MHIALVAEENDGLEHLCECLRMAGQSAGIIDPVSHTDMSPDDRPEVFIARGPDPHPLLRRLSNATSSPCVIALLDNENLSRFIPVSPWTDFALAPWDATEILLRIRLHFARSPMDTRDMIQRGDLVLDITNYCVYARNERIDLTYKEYELLRFLASHPGRVFTRESLLTNVWGYDYYGGSRTIDVHVRRIRSKLPSDIASQIETVHQVGYRFSIARQS